MKSMEKVMQKWKSYGKHFQQNRLYMGILLLTAVCAYGYKVTNAPSASMIRHPYIILKKD